ncbi:MAG: sensor histidine kinase [Caulobacteraceae bacterium]|nr:sensor histidine kinase [Caulobacteraceae bacterium]
MSGARRQEDREISQLGTGEEGRRGSDGGAGSDSAALIRARSETRALLHEVDHRVKNNLQLISSLILLQARRVESQAAREALRGVLERVNAISIVHRRLFQATDMERFDLAQFVRDLVEDMTAVDGRHIEVKLDLLRIDIPAARAASVALVVNELVSNAFRHAYPNGEGAVEILVRRVEGAPEIVVCDHGGGLADPETPPRGFGLTIADLLCRQLSANCSFADSEPGVRATVRLPVEPN